MKPILEQGPETRSADVVGTNVEALKGLFPEAFTEGRIDFEVLKQLLGGAVEEREEKYGLNWHGKRQARQLALTPSTGTLRPAPEDSVDWETTQNLMIEGDNLEVLKLLQKSYAGKVKMIYIDPPYNTGKDFVYPDDFNDNVKNYLELTSQSEDGIRLTSNPESSGRFHTDWLNMIYPRLLIARNLLADDGVIFISLDEKEIQALRLLCSMVFGDECFLSCLTVLCNPKGRSQDKYFATTHEYVMAFSKSVLSKGALSIEKDEAQIDAEYGLEDDGGKYRLMELRNTHREFGRHNRPNLYYPIYLGEAGDLFLDNEVGSIPILPTWDDGFAGCWTWDIEKAEKDLSLLVAREVNGNWKVYRKSYASGSDRMLKTILINPQFYTERGQREFNDLFGSRDRIFQSPKSPFLLSELIAAGTSGADLILDFFGGSGTCGDAVFRRNALDGGQRRVIIVQLPVPLSPEVPDQKNAAEFCDLIHSPRNLAELTKERLRRAGGLVREQNPLFPGDLGFRVFKLDSTNIRPWEPNRDRLAETLEESVEHIKAGRSEQDILFEVLLKLGLELTVPIETRTIAGKTVYSVGLGALLVCLAERIDAGEVEALSLGIVEWHTALAPAAESTVVFRDSAFADDVAKTNLTAILAQHGLENVRSL